MMSIPGLGTRPFGQERQPLLDVTPPAPPVVAPLATPKKKFSFLRHSPLTGIASWYGAVLNGHKTASGETFDMNGMTACHRTLPFGTMVRVVDTHSGKSVIVRINDRGVLFADRVIDLSRAAAEALGMRQSGVANVRLEVLGKQPSPAKQLSSQAEASEAAPSKPVAEAAVITPAIAPAPPATAAP